MCAKYDNPSKGNMRDATLNEAADLLRVVAGERRADEKIKGVFRRLSKDLKDWSYGRVRAVWYRDPRVRVRTAEVDQLRALAQQRAKPKAAADDLAELRNRISRLEALLELVDPAFHSQDIAALRALQRAVDGKAGAVD